MAFHYFSRFIHGARESISIDYLKDLLKMSIIFLSKSIPKMLTRIKSDLDLLTGALTLLL